MTAKILVIVGVCAAAMIAMMVLGRVADGKCDTTTPDEAKD